MQFLLDTHILLWFMNGDTQLPEAMMNIISDKSNQCFVSIASIWEIAIKCNIGKLKLNTDFNKISDFLGNNDLIIIPIELTHLETYLNLALLHRDPFDRVIIAQGISEHLTILTADDQFRKYPVICL
jgi:PIN domain nuclease of toxin-antitoxin system